MKSTMKSISVKVLGAVAHTHVDQYSRRVTTIRGCLVGCNCTCNVVGDACNWKCNSYNNIHLVCFNVAKKNIPIINNLFDCMQLRSAFIKYYTVVSIYFLFKRWIRRQVYLLFKVTLSNYFSWNYGQFGHSFNCCN